MNTEKATLLVSLACLVLLAIVQGCGPAPPDDYTGHVTTIKINGVIETVEVQLPFESSRQTRVMELNTREEVDRLVESLKSIIVDLEFARDQMPYIEPPIEKKQPTSPE